MNKPWRWTELQLWQIVFIWRCFWCENCVYLKQGGTFALHVYISDIYAASVCVCMGVFFLSWIHFTSPQFYHSHHQHHHHHRRWRPHTSFYTMIAFGSVYSYIYCWTCMNHMYTVSTWNQPPKLINCIEVNNTCSFFNGKCSLVASVFFHCPVERTLCRIFFFTLRFWTSFDLMQPLWETDNKMSQNSENYDLVYIMLTVFCGLNGWLPFSHILKCVCAFVYMCECVKDSNKFMFVDGKKVNEIGEGKGKKFPNK